MKYLIIFFSVSYYQFFTSCSYKPPSKFWLSTQALPALYKVTKRRLKTVIEEVKDCISLTTDGWKNVANVGFITLTARYVHTTSSMNLSNIEVRNLNKYCSNIIY